MKILLAGATGAIGQPLVDLLIQEGQEVFGITQSQARAHLIAAKGARSVVLNVLDRKAVIEAVGTIKPDVMIDMLTHLPKEYTPEAMQEAAELNNSIRMEGGGNLLAAAIENRVRRCIVQSTGFYYAPGKGLADESVPFAFEGSPGVAAGSKQYAEIERRALENGQLEGVAMRFGFFYGPGTWFHKKGNVAEQVRGKKFPIIGEGSGVWNFVHIEDAAKAVLAGIYCYPGAYNIVNDHPSPLKEWLPAFARHVEAGSPPWLTLQEGLKQRGEDSVYYATKLRGASNAKARHELNFQPRTFEWFTETPDWSI